MAYARIAARHFGTDHHEYYVTPDDLVASIPQHRRASTTSRSATRRSCRPTIAHDGARTPASTRCSPATAATSCSAATRATPSSASSTTYETCRGALRTASSSRSCDGRRGFGRLPLFSKARRATSSRPGCRCPTGCRCTTCSRASATTRCLTPDFLAQRRRDGPPRQQRARMAAVDAASLVNRMLAYDWRYTLADNDLPKVAAARRRWPGVAVGFPLLDDALVDFSLRLPPHYKLKGLKLALVLQGGAARLPARRDHRQEKHGFGLPFGVWCVRHAALRELAASRSLGPRHGAASCAPSSSSS